MNQKEKVARATLALTKGVTPVKLKEILTEYQSAYDYCMATSIKIDPNLLRSLGECILIGEERYPSLLKEIDDPPPYIYMNGHLKKVPEKSIAIVGTRDMTSYGAQATKEITEKYVKLGYCIVSGLASGIDSVVHKTCLDMGGKTIAVLGGNVHKAYPSSNIGLYERIKNSGCIISEFNKNIGYAKFMFARRNRIIAGLAQKVIVVEAPEKSGAMITAKYALQYNRELVAVPGSIYQKMSAGCNRLIYQTQAQIYYKQAQMVSEMVTDPIDKLILEAISEGNSSLDEIMQKVYMSRPDVLTRLLNLEMQEIIAKDLFDRYIVLS